MKKYILLTIIAFLFCNVAVTAQEESFGWDDYHGTVSLGVSINFPNIKNSSYNKDVYPAFNLSGVYELFLHKKPLFNTLKFAMDIGLSGDYGRLKEEKLSNAAGGDYSEMDDKYIRFAQVNLGLRLGPSIVFKIPRKNFFINLYAHFIPSVSSLIDDNELSFSYIPYNGIGLRLFSDEIGFGAEYIQGAGKFNNIAAEAIKKSYKDNPHVHINVIDSKYIMETKLIRLYVSMVL